jgi:hypothetical protein
LSWRELGGSEVRGGALAAEGVVVRGGVIGRGLVDGRGEVVAGRAAAEAAWGRRLDGRDPWPAEEPALDEPSADDGVDRPGALVRPVAPFATARAAALSAAVVLTGRVAFAAGELPALVDFDGAGAGDFVVGRELLVVGLAELAELDPVVGVALVCGEFDRAVVGPAVAEFAEPELD